MFWKYKIFLRVVTLKGTALLLFSLMAASLFSCTKEDSVNSSGEEMQDKVPIEWNIYTVDNNDNQPHTRALLEGYTDLRDLCTATESAPAEKIGLFGTYELEGSEVSVFDNADLWWWEKENGNPFNDVIGDKSHWNYDGDERYWVDGATYSFRAYFPKSKVTLEPGSGSHNLLAVYDSQLSQYDLLVASKSLPARSENPVLLQFEHALAAIRFTFKFADEDVTDNLTACWLENVKEEGFYTSSTINFAGSVLWPKSTANPVGSQMYYWYPSDPLQITGQSSVTAYSTAATVVNGSQYTHNDGWLLVIPQKCPGPETLQLCFRTSTGADVVYRVGLPAVELLSGNRYTFNVKISSTEIELKLKIADWNERDSSYEIDFNN